MTIGNLTAEQLDTLAAAAEDFCMVGLPTRDGNIREQRARILASAVEARLIAQEMRYGNEKKTLHNH